MVTVEKNGKNHIVVIPGANYELTPEDIWNQRQAIEQCQMVVMQLEIPMDTVKYTLELAKKAGKITILNPAHSKLIREEILKNVAILIPNEHELNEISGIELQNESKLKEATMVMLNKGVKAVIVTLGEKDCCYVDSETFKLYPAHQVKVQDTTAAGDSFIGGFAASYIKSRDMMLQ